MDCDMTNSRHDENHERRDPHLSLALDHARVLAEAPRERTYSPGWSAHAAHVGDLSVLALALRD
jgi:hypothetical protein